MRVLVCGDRDWTKRHVVDLVLGGLYALHHKNPDPLVVIDGGARGADTLACEWAQGAVAYDASVGHEHYPAKWDEHGKAAGPIRNQQMLDEGKPDVVFAFHDDLAASKGTADMVRRAKKAGVPVYVVSRP